MYIILDLWLVPYFIAFHYGQKLDHVKIYLYIQDTFYICDVLISFFTAYVERKGYEKHLENRPHLVALRYIKSYLIFDIIAYFGSLPFSGCYTIWCILKFLRIYKFVGLLKIHGLNNVSIDLRRRRTPRWREEFQGVLLCFSISGADCFSVADCRRQSNRIWN